MVRVLNSAAFVSIKNNRKHALSKEKCYLFKGRSKKQ